MSYEEYRAKRRQDPEYREVERQLKPILDLAGDVLYLRMERGWSQSELARRVGTRQANISRLENGLANPTFKFLQKLSEIFETDLTVRLRPQPVEVRTQVIRVAPLVQYVIDEDEESTPVYYGAAGSVPTSYRAAKWTVSQEIVCVA